MKAPTGNVRFFADGPVARIRVEPGPDGRASIALATRTKAQAFERAAELSRIARSLRGCLKDNLTRDELVELLKAGGEARTEEDLLAVRETVDLILAGEAVSVNGAIAPTFEKFAEEWTTGRLRTAHPDHVRDKDHVRDEQLLRDYINPVVGVVHLPEMTLERCERVMSKLPSRLSARSRRHVAQCLRKVLSLAVYPGRYLATNPIPREWMPKIPKSANKAKSYLYPDEDAKLMACTAIPVERRLAYGILAREGMRASELDQLRWRDVDLERGRVRLDENKTDDPRAWALSPDVVRVLKLWKKFKSGEAGELVLGLDLEGASEWLRGRAWDPKTRKETRHKNDRRGDLRTAGVQRAELFERTKARQPFRVHDLRATFVTVSLANGKTEQWVSDRTGHKSAVMIATYARQARTWEELELGTLRPLDKLLPETRKGHWAVIGPTTVARAGIEPATRGFSVRCSTN
jgi:integrase